MSYSLVDRRPEVRMAPYCKRHGIQLLTYGTLLGGFLSDRSATRTASRVRHASALTMATVLLA